ncbi:MAG: translocation/assembly module TamB, partial [Flavobacteriaceae bacterium]|nr:translocation/assembly module TamB [Flavobacteriaceae bacterium]
KGENQTNLDVFVARFDEEEPSTEPSDFLLSSSDITIVNGKFTMSDENRETVQVLNFDGINLNATNFLINGSDVSTRINTLSFNDSRGLKMKNLSSNFKYTRENMLFDNLDIKTESSTLKGALEFKYNREDLQYFTEKVLVDATFTEADIALSEINTFYDEFGPNQRAKFKVKLSGTLNDLKANDLELTTSSRSKIYGDINFKNLFNSDENNFEMVGDFDNLSSSYNDLTALLPNVLGQSIPTAFDKLGYFTLKGATNIKPTTIDADVDIFTDLGTIVSNLHMTNIDNIDNALYKGNVILREFDLGTFLNDPKVGTVSLDMAVDG